MAIGRKKSLKDSSLLTTVGNNLTENSNLIKNLLDSSKKAIVPVSKGLDYVAVSMLTLFLYKLAETYM